MLKKGAIMRSGVEVMVGVICLSIHKSYHTGTWLLRVFIEVPLLGAGGVFPAACL